MPTAIILERKEAFQKTTAHFKQVTDQARKTMWDDFCAECDPSDSTVTSRFWNLAKEIKSQAKGGSAGPQQITGLQGEPLRTDEEKGQAFKERFLSQLQTNAEDKVNTAWHDADQRIAHRANCEETPPVTVNELKGILRKTQKDTTPGPDGVRYSDLKNLNTPELEELVTIVNSSLEKGEIPSDWRECKMAADPPQAPEGSYKAKRVQNNHDVQHMDQSL